jgi:thioesterase domain-containing protein
MNSQFISDKQTIYSLVEKAWKETLPSADFSPAIAWADAGADSLDTLHLALRLEGYLNRKVSIDLVTPEITPLGLTTMLLQDPKKRELRQSNPVFLIPPIVGDEPILSKFRRSLSNELVMSMVELPNLDSPIPLLADVKATGRFIAAEISKCRPDGTILLAGYSFGGCVAYETAACLRAQGRQIGFLGLLDPVSLYVSLPSHEMEPRQQKSEKDSLPVRKTWTARITALLSFRGEAFLSYLDWLLFVLFLELKWFNVARHQVLFGKRWLSLTAFLRRRALLLRRLRMSALQKWRPQPLDVPGLLAASEAYIEAGSLRIWPVLCPKLDVVRLPGGHIELFEQKALAILGPSFLKGVTAVEGKP